MKNFLEAITNFLGLGLTPQLLHADHMIWRTIIVYIVSVLFFRMGKKRFSKPTSFDLVIILIFGSVMAKAITGESPFFATIIVGAVLMILHWLFSLVAVYSNFMGVLLKGRAKILIKDGVIEKDNLLKSHISYKDLLSALRLNAMILDPKDVHIAILERNGDISVIPKKLDDKKDIQEIANQL